MDSIQVLPGPTRCEGPGDLMDFDLGMVEPAVTHEVEP